MFLIAVSAGAEELQVASAADLAQVLTNLHQLFEIMVSQLDVMQQQQQQTEQLQIQVLRLTAACGRKPAAPPVYTEPK